MTKDDLDDDLDDGRSKWQMAILLADEDLHMFLIPVSHVSHALFNIQLADLSRTNWSSYQHIYTNVFLHLEIAVVLVFNISHNFSSSRSHFGNNENHPGLVPIENSDLVESLRSSWTS